MQQLRTELPWLQPEAERGREVNAYHNGKSEHQATVQAWREMTAHPGTADRRREVMTTYRFAWAFTSTTGNGWGSTVVTVPGLMTEAVFKECEASIRERSPGLHITILSWQPFENEPTNTKTEGQ